MQNNKYLIRQKHKRHTSDRWKEEKMQIVRKKKERYRQIEKEKDIDREKERYKYIEKKYRQRKRKRKIWVDKKKEIYMIGCMGKRVFCDTGGNFEKCTF